MGKKELEDYMKIERNRQMLIKKFPSSAHGLANTDLIEIAFYNFDRDGDGTLDAIEWKSFLDFFAQLRLRYLQQIAFVNTRAYFGRGHKENIAQVYPENESSENLTEEDTGAPVPKKSPDHISSQ